MGTVKNTGASMSKSYGYILLGRINHGNTVFGQVSKKMLVVPGFLWFINPVPANAGLLLPQVLGVFR
jgi:hypothetical protein